MEKEIKFQVNMKVKDMYSYMMYNNYSTFSGILGLCISLVIAVILVVRFDALAENTRVVLGFFVLLFPVINPISLYSKSLRQVKLNSAYKKALHYLVNQDGVTVSQGEVSQTLGWEQIIRIVETKRLILIYSSKVHAFIFPKRELDGQIEDMRAVIKEFAKNTKIKLNKRISKGINFDNEQAK